MRVSTILDTIGHTPHVRLHRLFDPRVEVWMKLERANPGGSIKDRIAMTMIEDAEQRGLLTKDSVIIEPKRTLVVMPEIRGSLLPADNRASGTQIAGANRISPDPRGILVASELRSQVVQPRTIVQISADQRGTATTA